MRSLILGGLLCFLLFSCASWKSVQKKEETKSHYLPPNTASNKYAKKRNWIKLFVLIRLFIVKEEGFFLLKF